MGDGTTWAMLALAGTTALHSIPHIVQAWSKRSQAETLLLHQALAELSELRAWRKDAEAKMDALEVALASEKAARGYSEGQVVALQQQLDRTDVELGLWEKRARVMKEQFDDLYDAVSSSSQGKSLPPRAPDAW